MSRKTHPKETTATNGATEPSELNGLLDSVTAIAGPALALTSTDRKRSPKLRKGGEAIVPTILAISDRIGLSVPSHPTAAIQASLDRVKTLSPVHERVVSAEKQLDDAIFQAQSEMWEGATVHYSMLKRLARTNGDVAKSLAPVVEFFAHKPKDAGAPTTEPTNAQASVAPPPPAPAPSAAPNGAPRS